MLYLFTLEFRQSPIKEYLLIILTTAAFSPGLTYLSAYIPHKNSAIPLGIATVRAIAPAFSNYKTIAAPISILSMVCFAVFPAAVFSQFIIHDFVGKRFYLLLPYPIKSSTIFLVKAVTIVILSISAMLLCNPLVFTFFHYTETIFPIVRGDAISTSLFYDTGKLSLLFSVIAAAIDLIPMQIGFVKKSSHITLVVSFAFSVLLSNLPDVSLLADLNTAVVGFTAFAIVLSPVGVIFTLTLIPKASQMEGE